ncbi:hypothetical protein PI125_g9524 [Phytophthora idaei]|nr:hypothetical protein PI125_g9524 [Phytophthora idaei]
MLPLVEFALNNARHASTGLTPFYVNGLANPRVPLTPPRRGSGLSGGGIADRLADISPVAVRKQVGDFVSLRLSVLRQVRDAMAESQDLQKEYADVQGRGNVERFEVGDLVLLNAKNLPTHAVSAVFKTKLRPRFIGPFKVVAKKGLAYTLNLPKKMRTHPVFYVGLLKPYQDPAQVSVEALVPGRQEAAEPQAAGRQRVAEPQDADRTAEGAATDRADPAAEQPDAQGRRPGSEGHSVPPTSPPDGASLRDLLPSGRVRRSRHERRRSASQHAGPAQSRRGDSQRGVQARLVLRRLCSTSMVSSTITWNALWRGSVARVAPNILRSGEDTLIHRTHGSLRFPSGKIAQTSLTLMTWNIRCQSATTACDGVARRFPPLERGDYRSVAELRL